jgi:hypothetical protein
MNRKPGTRPSRFFKWFLIVFIAILIIIAGGLGYFARKISPFLSQRLKEQVIRSSDSLYHVEFSELSVNPFSGTIGLKDFRLIPDTTVYNRLKKVNRAPENIFDLSVPQFELRHAHPLRLILRRTVKIKDIRIEYPVVKILHQDLFPNDTTQSVQKTLANLISGPLKAIYVNRIALDNMSISYKNNSDSADKGFNLQQADIILRDLSIDSSTVKDTTRFFYAKDFWIHLSDLKMLTAEGLYWLKLKDVVYSTQRQSGLAKELAVEPRYTEAVFDKKVGHQQDRVDLKIDSLTVSGINLLNIFREKKIGKVKMVNLSGADLDIYHNRKLPLLPKIKPLPQQMLRKAGKAFISKNIAAIFTVDTVKIRHVNIAYRELSPKSDRIGKVTFEQVNGTFYHITTDSAALARDSHCRADLETLFMGRGNTRVHFDFNLADPANAFSYSGHLGPMKTNVLNKATRYLGLLKIKSGNIQQLGFRFSANDRQAVGSVTLTYDDLAIKLLSLDEVSGRLKNKGLASLVANILVIKNNNIRDPVADRTEKVDYKRDPEKSVFNLMWKSLFQGVKGIVGMDEEAARLKEDFKGNTLIQKIKEKRAEKNQH